MLALNGATAGSLISYIYPAAIFLSVTHYREEMRTVAKVVQQDILYYSYWSRLLFFTKGYHMVFEAYLSNKLYGYFILTGSEVKSFV